jgi:pyruvate formate lyase activating enzyme
MGIKIGNIQRMCFQDGPGIRTTVFLTGCSLHCPWCSNPELVYGNGTTDAPEYEVAELMHILKKDSAYWGTEGGVTFSGGEALLHAAELAPLWKQMKEEHIHLAVESALFVPEEQLRIALQYIDFFYVDVKVLEPGVCRKILGGDVAQYLRNVDALAGAGKEICFRVPCSREYVLTAENRSLLADFLAQYREIPIQIFALHDLGKKKYEKLHREMGSFVPASGQELQEFGCLLERKGCRVEIIHL